MNKCVFCGSELINDKCPNGSHFKSMCINCNDCAEQSGKCFCNNNENMDDAVKKIKENVPSGYEIEEIKVKPLPLKDETKKCKRWNLMNNFVEKHLN